MQEEYRVKLERFKSLITNFSDNPDLSRADEISEMATELSLLTKRRFNPNDVLTSELLLDVRRRFEEKIMSMQSVSNDSIDTIILMKNAIEELNEDIAIIRTIEKSKLLEFSHDASESIKRGRFEITERFKNYVIIKDTDDAITVSEFAFFDNSVPRKINYSFDKKSNTWSKSVSQLSPDRSMSRHYKRGRILSLIHDDSVWEKPKLVEFNDKIKAFDSIDGNIMIDGVNYEESVRFAELPNEVSSKLEILVAEAERLKRVSDMEKSDSIQREFAGKLDSIVKCALTGNSDAEKNLESHFNKFKTYPDVANSQYVTKVFSDFCLAVKSFEIYSEPRLKHTPEFERISELRDKCLSVMPNLQKIGVATKDELTRTNNPYYSLIEERVSRSLLRNQSSISIGSSCPSFH